jgi:hypothetical protein
MTEFVGNKDFDSLIEFVGNRLDRSGKKFNRSIGRPDPDNYSDDSSTDRSLAWFPYPSRPHKRRDVDPNFALRLGDAAHITPSQSESRWDGGRKPPRLRHDGIVRVGAKKRMSAAAAARRVRGGDIHMRPCSASVFLPSIDDATLATAPIRCDAPFGRRSSRYLLTQSLKVKSPVIATLREHLIKRFSVLHLGVGKWPHEYQHPNKPQMAGWLWSMTGRPVFGCVQKRAACFFKLASRHDGSGSSMSFMRRHFWASTLPVPGDVTMKLRSRGGGLRWDLQFPMVPCALKSQSATVVTLSLTPSFRSVPANKRLHTTSGEPLF